MNTFFVGSSIFFPFFGVGPINLRHKRLKWAACRKMSKLYVGNLPESTKEKDLRDLFEAFGIVEEVAILRGYGFVVRFAPRSKVLAPG